MTLGQWAIALFGSGLIGFIAVVTGLFFELFGTRNVFWALICVCSIVAMFMGAIFGVMWLVTLVAR